ncbi:type II toxin-antitoxin system RelE/ParE family toxin [Agrobacterium radiobacter]|uniref:Plasmid stabilization system n=1 Tax=Agrobacterium tumefaciens str. B6 TaxID=1183423 RepID=A0A822UUT2_AGRTU|nr:type II toxin-antitoxin system RelE/ParE family toxin [Agrobacterium tumefaciens]MQB28241.1 type II toxin-antitoxin system RelE/ParE family toxin [Agrobacterium tumefaciens]NTA04958.1 type II toxin-antitoxin system RelE/ParE family toxin [Agrobacterium tumefaciens]NTA91553.1 type II toxin-antitoxin system RelE/ParE family toxin [Agrobacterium tumefaciens]NTB12702.1 type II toxin-antitoxin system RelE/ParE family toxin [Agrobacterium tumefaciens]CVI15151.1 conserved hypothetical protein [Agr
MKHYIVRLSPEAESDLLRIYAFISEKSASREVGRRYVDRITGFLASFETFPERGTVRSDIRDGLRIIGFENRVSVAFIVDDDNVVVLRIAYGGQQIEFGEH